MEERRNYTLRQRFLIKFFHSLLSLSFSHLARSLIIAITSCLVSCNLPLHIGCELVREHGSLRSWNNLHDIKLSLCMSDHKESQTLFSCEVIKIYWSDYASRISLLIYFQRVGGDVVEIYLQKVLIKLAIFRVTWIFILFSLILLSAHHVNFLTN